MNLPMFDLRGRVALITGGNSGIGLGMAEGLAQAGAAVCIWGTNPDKNAAALERLTTHGTKVAAHVVDVGNEAAVVDGVAWVVGEFGRIDACFANAGSAGAHTNPPFVDSTLEQWRAITRVNLDGAYLVLREAAKQMIAQGDGGSLVGTSSISVDFGSPREEAYAASKAGVIAMMRGLAVELGRHRIRANALLPGWTMSPMMEPWAAQPGVAEKILPRIPLRRWGKPEEWAGIAVYLASSASTFHTGDAIRIDGGYSVY
ncbi:MAG: SDR family oxidoreductase [Actinomycetota bacterium]|nr:SDR family oxidoreductase [Actinomycetota bacterium]